MKRRDFIKLPALIPGLKKFLDDFTLPEVKETPTTDFLEEPLEYPDFTSGPQDPIPRWEAFPFDELDIDNDSLICKVSNFPEIVYIRDETDFAVVHRGPIEFFMKSKETLKVPLNGAKQGVVFAQVR